MKREIYSTPKRFIHQFSAVAILLFTLASCSQKPHNPRVVLNRDYKNEILKGREAIQLYLIGGNFGVSVSVSVDGQTVWSEGLGYANYELKSPASPQTKYRIGRSSQMFAAMAIARLQEQGKLNVHDSFRKYVPNYPEKQYDFSIYNLGTHTAGFPETDNSLLMNPDKLKDLKAYVHASDNDSLVYPPNEYFNVSDYGSCLLGILAETLEHKSYPKLVQEMLLDTLGLHETMIDNPGYITANRAAPYSRNFIAQIMNAPAIDSRFVAPAYGYLSTADDLNKLGQKLMNREFFSDESYDLFFTRNKLKNGYVSELGFGWTIFEDRQGRTVYIQQGSTIGGSSFLAIFPEQKLVVSLCTNIEDRTESMPSAKIAQLFLDRIEPLSPEAEDPQATEEQ
ncbi:serine hydrolase [Mangrovibacterium marinum]|uniref:CubicO group peptidase (Beta-lactamase class C family) n=1 Tax=Mangrovibacterium marinum TaxID=1639118 RepID=A0A2T5C0J2_9BACT|nr:serine hydrolase domain-containing protein [Mangrovibacterium marinum]PTN08077.1 CubicO group peptidase (beta-lactamase class C family) [Mangrovibacterium marinum]